MVSDYQNDHDSSVLWPAHFLGREKEYVHLERMTNFDQLPKDNFQVICFPLKLAGADASWVRAVAVL
jgi:cyclase